MLKFDLKNKLNTIKNEYSQTTFLTEKCQYYIDTLNSLPEITVLEQVLNDLSSFDYLPLVESTIKTLVDYSNENYNKFIVQKTINSLDESLNPLYPSIVKRLKPLLENTEDEISESLRYNYNEFLFINEVNNMVQAVSYKADYITENNTIETKEIFSPILNLDEDRMVVYVDSKFLEYNVKENTLKEYTAQLDESFLDLVTTFNHCQVTLIEGKKTDNAKWTENDIMSVITDIYPNMTVAKKEYIKNSNTLLNKVASELGAKSEEDKENIEDLLFPMLEGKQTEYQKFFSKKLATFNVKTPMQLDDAKKKQFYAEIEKEWKKDDDHTTNEAITQHQQYLSSAEYQKAKKLTWFKSSDYKWDSSQDLYKKVNETKFVENITLQYGKDTVFSIHEDNFYINTTKIDAKKIKESLGSLFHYADLKSVNSLVNLYENRNSIIKIDFAEKMISKLYEGMEYTLYRLNEGKIYLNQINKSLNLNVLNECELTDVVSTLKKEINVDLTKVLESFKSEYDKIAETVSIEKQLTIKKLEYLVEKKNELYSNVGMFENRTTDAIDALKESINTQIDALKESLKELQNKNPNQTVIETLEEDGFSKASIIKAGNGYKKGQEIWVFAEDVTSKGNGDKLKAKLPDGKDVSVLKSMIKIK